MKSIRSRAAAYYCAAVLLAACSQPTLRSPEPAAAGPGESEFGMLAFGDSGYSIEYDRASAKDVAATKNELIEAAHRSWLRRGLPEAEFVDPPIDYDTRAGGYRTGSGLASGAAAMQAFCSANRCQSAVMLGDNIYPRGATLGLDGIGDAQRFRDLFVEPFGGLGDGQKGFRVYAVLGNHDWLTSREGALEQIRFLGATSPFYMNGPFYSVKPRAAGGQLEIFAIDTEMLLTTTTVHSPELGDDGSELPATSVEEPNKNAVPQTDTERAMLAWLERELKGSTARWKIVIGHHPLWSAGGNKFEESRALRRLILPMLCRYADLYIAGHEHILEVDEDSCAEALPGEAVPPLPSIISGAASKQRLVNAKFKAFQDRNYPQLRTHWTRGGVWGFAHVAVAGEALTVTMIVTPNDRSARQDVVYTKTFARRSDWLRGADTHGSADSAMLAGAGPRAHR